MLGLLGGGFVMGENEGNVIGLQVFQKELQHDTVCPPRVKVPHSANFAAWTIYHGDIDASSTMVDLIFKNTVKQAKLFWA